MANRIKLTKEKLRLILEEVRIDGNISRACRYHGVSRTAVYDFKAKDTALANWFSAELEKAVELGIDGLIDECRRRAHHGVVEIQRHKGRAVGFRRHYSDTLAMFLIKAHRPEYRDQFNVGVSGENFRLNVNIGSPTDDGDGDA